MILWYENPLFGLDFDVCIVYNGLIGKEVIDGGKDVGLIEVLLCGKMMDSMMKGVREDLKIELRVNWMVEVGYPSD